LIFLTVMITTINYGIFIKSPVACNKKLKIMPKLTDDWALVTRARVSF